MSFQRRDDEEGHNIHFFKVILQSTLRDGELMIPRSFVKQYGNQLSNPVILKLPNGDKWEVCWTKRDPDIWFQKGWRKFARHYSLTHGHFLVFRYEGGFHFNVLIFKENALEIDYPVSITCTDDEEEGTNKNHEDAQKNDEDHDPVEIRYESEGPPSPSPQPHKKIKTNTGASRVSLPKDKNWSKTECNKMRKEALEEIEGTTALERAKKFQSECDNPSFIRTLSPSYLQSFMAIPTCFSKRYMNGMEGTATVVVCENMNKEWKLRFKFNESSNRATMTSGWMSIVQKHNLEEGDVCVFEMIDSTKFSFKMEIFRAIEEPSSEQFQDSEIHEKRRIYKFKVPVKEISLEVFYYGYQQIGLHL